jgi:hypothetical protein
LLVNGIVTLVLAVMIWSAWPSDTLKATALVNEAYLRLIDVMQEESDPDVHEGMRSTSGI